MHYKKLKHILRNNMTDTVQLTKKDFTSDQDVRWCPGCGDYAILAQVQKVFPTLGVPKLDNVALTLIPTI